ncbi:hypothetical protein [Micromonospora sp. NPDC048898]|uniref:hypothetical protein n=1 Tax=Micromonospora sp. NPDC048898 TaxID=3364260 RepID=UPI003722BC5C
MPEHPRAACAQVPEHDEVGQLVGGTLHVGDRAVRLRLWEGEVISYAAGRG